MKTWEEFIGQQNIVQELKGLINYPKVSVLFRGFAGCGKTELAKLFAAYKGDWAYFVAPNIPTSFNTPKIVTYIIDESHEIKRVEDLFETMTSTGFIFCTTEVAEIPQTLQDRCIIFNFREYTPTELFLIIRNQYLLERSILWLIVDRCRSTPRIALQLALRLQASQCIDLKSAELFLNSVGIYSGGFTDLDKKYLSYLSSRNDPTSINTVASYLNTSIETVRRFIEPFLIQQDLVEITSRGRRIKGDI